MLSSNLAIATLDGNRLSAPLPIAKAGGPLYIRSTHGQHLVLSDADYPGQPAQLKVTRQGKNLLVTEPGTDEPFLVVYNFYANNAVLQGIGEDGKVHDWVNADNGDEPQSMDENESAFVILSNDANDITPLAVLEHNGGAWMAAAAFVGLLGLGGIARAMQNQHSGPGEKAPPAPDIDYATDSAGIYTGKLEHSGLTDDATPQLNGRGHVPGQMITVYADGEMIGSTIVNDEGFWTFTPDTSLPHGQHTFTATVTSESGLVSAHSTEFILDIDLIAPARPVVVNVDDNVGDLTGKLLEGAVTDDPIPVFSGNAEPGAKIVFMLDGAVVGSMIVAADGGWQWQPTEAIPDGYHSFTAQATDPAGNIGLPSKPFTFTVDTLISQPVISAVSDAVSGGAFGDLVNDGTGLTNDNRPRLSGSAEPGSIVTLYDGTVIVGSVLADATTGAWTWQHAAADTFTEGAHSITVQATDPAGNVSVRSDAFTFTVDTLISQPVIGAVSDAVSGGAFGDLVNDGTGLTNDNRPRLSGSAEPGSIVTLYDGTVIVGSVLADATTGAWTWQHATADTFTEGAHTITVQAIDPAGNVSVRSDAFTFTVDTLISQPVISAVSDAVSGGAFGDLVNDGTDLTNDNRPRLSGSAEPGSIVTLYDGAVIVGSVLADATTGAWTWQHAAADTFTEGAHTITVQATDMAGNVSVRSDAFTFTVDTLISQPVISAVSDAVSGGAFGDLVNDGTGLTNDNRPRLSGSAEPGSIVTLYDGAVIVGSVLADATTGAWTWQHAAADTFTEGAHTITVQATDMAGNVSAPSDTFVITVDTQIIKPTLAIITDAASGGTVGAISNDGIGLTYDAKPLISGNAEPGSLVTIYDGANIIGSVQANTTSGAWSWQYSGADKFQEGAHTLCVIATDAAGNISNASDSFTITVDTQTSQPTIIKGTDNVGALTETILQGHITDDPTPDFSGKAEPNSLVFLYDNGQLLGSFKADNLGDWSWTLPNLNEGMHSITVESVDAAGNKSAPSAAYDFKLGQVWDFNDGTFNGWTIVGNHAIGNNTAIVDSPFGGKLVQFQTAQGNLDFSGDVMRNTIVVEAGVTYDFNFILKQAESWALIAPAQLAFTIDGVPVSQYYTVNQTPQRVEGSWTATKSGTVTLAIHDLVKTGTGNDFWVDDIAIARHVTAAPTSSSNAIFDFSSLENDNQPDVNSVVDITIDSILNDGIVDLFHNSGSKQFIVNGQAGDEINLSDILPSGTDTGNWNHEGDITVGGVSYQVFQHSGGEAELLVQQDVLVHLNNH